MQNVAPVNVPPVVVQAALALAGVPPCPEAHVSSFAAPSTVTVQPASLSVQLVPSLRVPAGSVQTFSARVHA